MWLMHCVFLFYDILDSLLTYYDISLRAKHVSIDFLIKHVMRDTNIHPIRVSTNPIKDKSDILIVSIFHRFPLALLKFVH